MDYNFFTMALKEALKSRVYNFVTSLRTAAFVVGSTLIIFAALRNSFTWHLHHFWGVSCNFWQEKWSGYLELTGENEFLIYVIGLFLATFIPFWMCNIPLLIIDFTEKPAFLYQYKIQEEKNIRLKWAQVKRTALVVLFNQFTAILYNVVAYRMIKWRGVMSHGPELPTFQCVLVELLVFVLLEEIGFYYSHRLLHHPAVYKHIHKVHHEWNAPISIVSLYCHPLESLFSNYIPVMSGPMLYGSHVVTMYLWVAMAVVNSTNAHSGYHFPGFPSNEAHDYHHLKFNEMFGVLGILDRLHNTDAKFRSLKAYERHQTYFSLEPIKKLIPDPPRLPEKASTCEPKSGGCDASKED